MPPEGRGMVCVEKTPLRSLRSLREKNPVVESHAEAADMQRGEGWYVEKIPPRLLRSLREKNPAVESHAEAAEPAEG